MTTDTDYIARLQRHLVNYKTNVLLVQESGLWGTPPRPYPHILPAERRELNIVTPLREAFWREQRRRGWKLHKYFHHLSSSQALAFNLLFPLYPEVPMRMVATRRALGLPVDVPCHLDFEAVLDASEGTNIDVLISTAEGTRTIIEIKLTERAFGTALADDRHLAKLAGIYRPRLAGRVAESCLEPSAFFRDYQLYRNLAQVRRDSADRVLLLLPRARTQLWQHAASWCKSPTLGSLGECIKVVALEDVVAAFIADSASLNLDSGAVTEVSRKYIPASS
jgi:hypothetical protein